MILTIDVPDDLAAQVAAAGVTSVDVNRFAVAGIAAAIPSVPAVRRRRSIMEYEGVGEGRPGAIGGDVQEYIRNLRDEGDDDAAARGLESDGIATTITAPLADAEAYLS